MDTIVLGAVAYDPKVVTIWEGFREWLRSRDVLVDYVLYPNYERQVEDLVAGRLDVAWNSPLAWARARRLAAVDGRTARATVMRDTDRDLTSVILVRSDADINDVGALSGRTVAVGALDSPQSRLIPLAHLATAGLDVQHDVTVQRHDVMVGKHGDHVGGERQAVEALLAGEADAVCILAGNLLAFAREGLVAPEQLRVVAETEPYDHCVFTVIDDAVDRALIDAFDQALLSMSFDDPEVRGLMELEGLRRWRPGRTDGLVQVERAVDLLGFYDEGGGLRDPAYRP